MYEAISDPYCYSGSTVLINIPGLTARAELDRFEAVATARRFQEPMPAGRWGLRHYCTIHHHIFRDVYSWAGRLRTVRISKGDSVFCYPERIDAELRRVFTELRRNNVVRQRDRAGFVTGAAHVLADLNAIHAFRDGNGRAQLAFMTLLAAQAGHPLDLKRLDPPAFLSAMIASFQSDEEPLKAQLANLIA
ncbi:Fic/DOC family protein [Methylobacterium nonmethylotrophicum]|uniref:protein adenylyltransferase n=1 Tax=Methylobacterium nonmethylotrophicum TaxID=1141884 RepID=A0A4Z0NVZ2_9HYPH|nr:Fic family protein [Methylobacterium nonmethylotrophicum]TGE01901.1 adenosine monophosphate-protein transferase [Methylobacterium nonmethylotrophicum]